MNDVRSVSMKVRHTLGTRDTAAFVESHLIDTGVVAHGSPRIFAT